MNQTLVQYYHITILFGVDKNIVKIHMSKKYASLVTDKETSWLSLFFSLSTPLPNIYQIMQCFKVSRSYIPGGL